MRRRLRDPDHDRHGRGRAGLVLLAAGLVGLGTFLSGGLQPLSGQGVRGFLTTSARWVELRPFDRFELTGAEAQAAADEGFIGCRGVDLCTIFRAGDVQDAYTLTQDVSMTAWGLGARGLSATVYLRGRSEMGADFILPRSDDEFDAILAYAEWVSERWRVRAGRQRLTSGLGFSGYDGVSARALPLHWLTVEAYGGRSLAPGLAEPRHEALEGIEQFFFDRDAYLFGGSAEVEWQPGSVATFRYQREIWSDRSALLSERASVDLRTTFFDRIRFNGGADWDFAFEKLGKARAVLELPLRQENLLLRAVGRRYMPYFELWTIWGFFSPVGYHEGRLEASWSPLPGLGIRASGGYRQYEDPNANAFLVPVRDNTWLASAGLRWTHDAVEFDGNYRLEWGAGQYLSSVDGRIRWGVADRVGLMAQGTAFQSIAEFQVGEGVVYGGGLGLEAELGDRVGFSGGFNLYRNSYENRAGEPDWNQARAWSSLTVRVGSDPGIARIETTPEDR